MSKNKVFTIVVPESLSRQRLDKALVALLANKIPALSRARLQALIEEGHVTHSRKAVSSASRKVKTGETYIIEIPPPQSGKPKPQKIGLNIIYEDKDLLVIDKPAGMVVHPAPGNRDSTLVNALLAHCGKSLSGIGGVARPGIVHRLDKDTSGLMVVAKNDLAHQGLTKQFADRSLSRIYHAFVWGVPVPRAGSIEASIGRHSRDRKKMAVTGKGRAALTHYKVLKVFGGQGLEAGGWRKEQKNKPLASSPQPLTSLIECRLATGRTHQIRVHLAHKKHPVVGDAIYGGKKMNGKGQLSEALRDFPRQALHAMELRFLHPRMGKEMRFKSELPGDMAGLFRLLNKPQSRPK